MRVALLAITSAVLVGCFNPAPQNGALLCSADGRCPSSYHCATDGACWKDGSEPGLDMAVSTDMAATKNVGESCSASFECVSGNCVDGYCCSTSCTDACKACNVVGSEGVCAPVTKGDSPRTGHDLCGPDPVGTCMRDGMCDGSGACRLYSQGTQCKGSTCNASSNAFTAEATCDGKGVCITPTSVTCVPYVCADMTKCFGSCTGTGATQCSTGNSCVSNSCGPKPIGATCVNDTECGSGFCADNVCCGARCSGQCEACSLSASRGSCTAVSGAPIGNRNACAGDGSRCDGSCNGSGRTACAYPTGNVCVDPTCTAGVAKVSYCVGNGTCPGVTSTTCTPYVCGATACKAAPCVSDADCTSGNNYCDAAAHCSAWNPGLLAGLVLWLDAEKGVSLSGSVVQTWKDQSPNGTVGTATIWSSGSPAITVLGSAINGHSALHFDGQSYVSFGDAASLRWGTGAYLVEAVTRYSNSAGGLFGSVVYFKGDNMTYPYTGAMLWATTAQGYPAVSGMTAQLDSEHYAAGGAGLNNNAWHTHAMRRDATGTTLEVRYMGTSIDSRSVPLTNVSAPGFSAGVGGVANGGMSAGPLIGDIAEVVATSGNDSTEDRARLEAYLKWKYGL